MPVFGGTLSFILTVLGKMFMFLTIPSMDVRMLIDIMEGLM